eukprot:5271417-Pyramimonas_sp.AAC.1
MDTSGVLLMGVTKGALCLFSTEAQQSAHMVPFGPAVPFFYRGFGVLLMLHQKGTDIVIERRLQLLVRAR